MGVNNRLFFVFLLISVLCFSVVSAGLFDWFLGDGVTGNVVSDFDENLIAHYEFNGNADDVMGHETTNVGATFGDGVSGSAASFDGVNNRIVIADSKDIDRSAFTQRTLSIWFNADNKSLNEDTHVIYEQGGRSNGLNIYISNGFLYIGAWSEDRSWRGEWVKTEMTDSGKWHHVSLVLDGLGGTLTGYLDGDEFAVGVGKKVADHSSITIGRSDNTKFHTGDDGSAGEGFIGLIDEFRMYNKALNANEIEELYNEFTEEEVVEEETVQDICEDSDGGDNIYQQGITSMDGRNFTEYCYTDVRLRENYCLNESSMSSYPYDCPSGCVDGACVIEVIGTIEDCEDCLGGCLDGVCLVVGPLPSCSETITENCFEVEVTCEDEDGGINVYEKGFMTNGFDVNFEDYCLNDSFLIERHCESEDPNNFTIQYECSNGCEDGACILEREALEFVNIGPFEDQITETLTASVNITAETSIDALCTYNFDGPGESEAMTFFTTGNLDHSQGLTLNEGYYYIDIVCDDGDGQIIQDSIDFRVRVPDEIETKTCPEMKEFIKAPKDFELDGRAWEMRNSWNNSGWNDNEYYYSVGFSQEDGYNNNYISLDMSELSNMDDAESRLKDATEHGLCEQEEVNEKTIYLCKDLWSMAYNKDISDVGDSFGDETVAVWTSGNTFFRVQVHSYDYNNWDYDQWEDMQNQEHRELQDNMAEFLEKLVDNRAEYIGGFYLPWETRAFVEILVDTCGSDIEEIESYVSSWSCKTEPVICPPHGTQKEVCTRWNSNLGEDESREVEIQCSPGICSGCAIPRWFRYGAEESGDNICLPYGARVQKENGWTLKEITETRDDEDVEGLSVRGANGEGGELDLEVFSNGTALFYWGELNRTLVMNVGDVFDISSAWMSGMTATMTIDEIYYDSEDYNESYFMATFNMVGEYTYSQRVPDFLNLYCNYDGRVEQQKTRETNGDWATCQENFECDSNLCSGGSCIEINDMLSEAGAFKATGIKVLCRLADLFGVKEYEVCVAGRLE